MSSALGHQAQKCDGYIRIDVDRIPLLNVGSIVDDECGVEVIANYCCHLLRQSRRRAFRQPANGLRVGEVIAVIPAGNK